MRFQVPQFIEVEDKIFGPFTIKQFIYLAGGVGAGAALYFTLPFLVAVIIGIPIIVFAFLLAFYKVNNKPFINLVENFFKFSLNNKLYLWKKQEKDIKPIQKISNENSASLKVPTIDGNKLGSMNWQIDVSDTPHKRH